MIQLRPGVALRAPSGYGAASVGIALVAAISLAAFGVARGTWAVGGSDSSCYGLMAKAFASGHLQPTSELVLEAPWPNAAITFAPGGFIPSTLHANAAAPICAPGMSVLMTPFAAAFGPDAIFYVTPIAAAVLVLSAFAIAAQLAGGTAGVMAAILTATSPIVLYQTVQPMNDIVTAALWLAAIVCARVAGLSGFLIGLGIMVRPNLAPLAIVVAAIVLHRTIGSAHEWRRRVIVMIAAAFPGVIAMLALNHLLYGSPFSSGYGDAARFFATSHLQTNLTNYSRALYETQNIVPLVALLAPLVFTGVKRVTSALLLAFAAAVIGIYLLYEPFPEWWYLRFLIPAIVVLLVLSSAVIADLLSRANMGGVIPIAAVIIGVLGLRAAAKHDAFALQSMESRYRHTAEFARDRLPPNALVITEWESGSIRFHAGTEVLLWESLDPAWLDRAITWLRSKGLKPYLVFERREEAQFRDRFGSRSEVGALDWPPRFDINRQVRIFDPDDRARYLAGEPYPTELVRPAALRGR